MSFFYLDLSFIQASSYNLNLSPKSINVSVLSITDLGGYATGFEVTSLANNRHAHTWGVDYPIY